MSTKKVKQGDTIQFELTCNPSVANAEPNYFFDGEELSEQSLYIDGLRVGKYRLLAEMTIGDSILCESYKTIEVVSEIQPEAWKYDVISEFPHQTSAYTQGLTWSENTLYEGTGRYENSILAAVNIQTGEYFNRLPLDDSYFGEGITIMNDKIYQLTWQAQKCFIYDLNSFERIGEFEFNSREGWGLTNDGTNLIMSDGSHNLTVIDPVTFKEVDKFEVYNGSKRLIAINELEFAQGLIFANIYQKDDIAVIDPLSGKVIAMIDCKGLLDPRSIKGQIDVLNGIAYNSISGHFYLTGKWWPKLFEVSIDQSSPTP
ncbi:MAG: glutaminyl-peptide cyclotransferase [Bacteroidota bacterium]